MNRFSRWIALLGLTLVVALANPIQTTAQDKSPGGRYYAPGSETLIVQIRQKEQWLQSAPATGERYVKAIKDKTAEIKSQGETLKQRQSDLNRANSSWNNRVNPTCQSGETYANCSCRPGVVGKNQKRAEIRDAKFRVDQSISAIRRLDTEARSLQDRAQRFQREWQSTFDQWKDARQRLQNLNPPK